MATCITSPPDKPVTSAAIPGYQPYVQPASIRCKVELSILAFFAAMVSAALITGTDTLLQAIGVKQPAAYDTSRAALLWVAFMVAQSSWQARCTLRDR